MIPGSANPLLLAGAAEEAGYAIERSLRFNSSDSAYLSRSASASSTSNTTCTIAFWVKRSTLGAKRPLVLGPTSGVVNTTIAQFKSDNTFGIYFISTGSYSQFTPAVFRDLSAWYHIVVSIDTTQATSTNRCKIYVNGIQQTSLTGTAPPQNHAMNWGSGNSDGMFISSNYETFDGYLADIHFIDGQALDPTSFGEFDADTGIWNPIAYTGSYNTNGFHLPFSDNSTAAALGDDTSGNGNDWTVNNISVSPYINYASYLVTPIDPTFPFTASYLSNYVNSSGAILTSAWPGAYSSTGTPVTWIPTTTVTVGATLDIYAGAYSNAPVAFTATVTYTDATTDVFTGASGSASWMFGFSSTPVGKTIQQVEVDTPSAWAQLGAVRVDGQLLVTNLITPDSLVDVPTNGTETDSGAGNEVRGNYCTWNPLSPLSNGATLSNGNLDVVTVSSGDQAIPSTIFMSSGKWYSELTITTANGCSVGIIPPVYATGTEPGSSADSYAYRSTALKRNNSTNTSYGATFTNGDVIGIALDLDAGTLVFYKNGVSQGTAFTGISGTFCFAFGDISGAATTSCTANFGQRAFAYDISIGISDATGAIPILSTSDDYGQTLSSGTATDSNSANLVLALPMNGSNGGTTFTDYSATIKGSGTAKTVTANGDAQTSTTQSKWYGSSGLFDGAGDYLQAPAGTDFSYGTGDFTFEAWIYPTTSGTDRIIYAQTTSGNNYVNLALTTSNTFSVQINASGAGNNVTSTGTVTANVWTHIAVTRQSTVVKLFINGVQDGSGTRNVDLQISSTVPTIGTYSHTSALNFVGYIQDFRIYKGVAKYTANFTPPSSALYKALCTANLPAPTVENGSTVMDVVTYTGNGSTQTISGLGFSPDLVWIKNRTTNGYNHLLYDQIRTAGANKALSSDQTSAEGSAGDNATYGYMSAFETDGFTVVRGTDATSLTNGSTQSYAAWTWDAGSSTVSNTDGSITSSVRANPTAGFSIVSYTGNETVGATVGHGLGVKPAFAIFKDRNSGTRNFICYHSALGAGKFLKLNSPDGQGTSSIMFNNTEPTSTVFTLANNSETNSTNNMICWAFAPVEGYSSFGSYTGNGTTTGDGPFVFCGFRPRWVMIKCSSASTTAWQINDSARPGYNVIDLRLRANTAESEPSLTNAFNNVDFLSNGFKIRGTAGLDTNTSGATYVYACFAENPFALNARAR